MFISEHELKWETTTEAQGKIMEQRYMKRVFLGGTCNGSEWRGDLKGIINIDYFDPVVKDWTEECMIEEIAQRKLCDYSLYVITPKMTGVYSIAEAIDDSNKRPGKTVFCVINTDGIHSFDEFQIKSLEQVGRMIRSNGGSYFTSLVDVANYINFDTYTLK